MAIKLEDLDSAIVVDDVTGKSLMGVNLVSQASFSGDGILTTSYAEDYITRGMAFELQKRITLTTGQTLYLEINVALAVGKMVYALPLRMSNNLGNVFVDTYNADSSTGGTLLPVNNLNGLSAITPLTTVKTGVTPTGTPTALREYSVGTVKTVQSGGGGSASPGFPKIMNNAKPLYIKLVNQETTTVTFDLGIVWFEI